MSSFDNSIAPFMGGALALVGSIFSKYNISEEEKNQA